MQYYHYHYIKDMANFSRLTLNDSIINTLYILINLYWKFKLSKTKIVNY